MQFTVLVFLFMQDMPKQIQPNFVLDVEKSELSIQAGLQDRVVQVNTNLDVISLVLHVCTYVYSLAKQTYPILVLHACCVPYRYMKD